MVWQRVSGRVFSLRLPADVLRNLCGIAQIRVHLWRASRSSAATLSRSRNQLRQLQRIMDSGIFGGIVEYHPYCLRR